MKFTVDHLPPVTAVIEGRRYSTTSSEFAGFVVNYRPGSSDFRSELTGLYRSPKGRWFLAGQGGASSQWSKRSFDGGNIPGEGIKLISAKEAQSLLEKIDGDVERYFEVEEG